MDPRVAVRKNELQDLAGEHAQLVTRRRKQKIRRSVGLLPPRALCLKVSSLVPPVLVARDRLLLLRAELLLVHPRLRPLLRRRVQQGGLSRGLSILSCSFSARFNMRSRFPLR